MSILAQNSIRTKFGQRGMLSRMAPKRKFSDGFERQVERISSMMPGGNIGMAIIAMNSLLYGLYMIWPPYNVFSYMNNFTFSSYGISKGYIWSLFFCHFAHTSFFSYFLDSLIIGLLCQSLGMMHGNVFLAKGFVLSMLFGSGLLFLQNLV